MALSISQKITRQYGHLKRLDDILTPKFFSTCIKHKFNNYLNSHKISSCGTQILAMQLSRSFNISSLFGSSYGRYDIIKKTGTVSAPSLVPENIHKPDYYPLGDVADASPSVNIRNSREIAAMRKSGRIARQVMNAVKNEIKVGVSTDHLDRVAHSTAISLNSYPSPLHYKDFPKSICCSVNNVACHGVPDDRQLREGDIVSVDITVFHEGFHGDCCDTFCLPGTDDEGLRLVAVAKKARDEGIKLCAPGVPFAAIGEACEEVAEEANFQVVPVFIGHGIGENFHELPEILHYRNSGTETMKAGMTFTVEPIVSQGSEDVTILADGWTAVVKNCARAAQFEHTIVITESGHEILTSY